MLSRSNWVAHFDAFFFLFDQESGSGLLECFVVGLSKRTEVVVLVCAELKT